MDDMDDVAGLAANLALNSRVAILNMTHKANASHVGSSLSVIDILASLYTPATKLISEDPALRDALILSKGHAAAALYAILAEKDVIPKAWLETYCQNGAHLGGHVTSTGVPGVTLSTGSLGHGLPYGLGIAQGFLSKKLENRVFVVISDGECDEGTTWESALIANHLNLRNLCVIIDRNRIQSLGKTEETIQLEPLDLKWQSFGWEVRIVDGHSYVELCRAIEISDRPLVIIANTIKGRGVSFMEDTVLWHYKSPNESELAAAVSEIASGVTE